MFNNKTICITGASSGIGAALAKAYANSQTRLLLIGRNLQRLQEVAQFCQEKGATATIGQIDITDKSNLQQWLQQQDAEQPIDLLIANAGLSATQAQKSGADLAQAESMLVDVHMQGTLYTIHSILQTMLQRKSGQIAIMSSQSAFIPLKRAAAYTAVKAALLQYGLAIRQQYYAEGVNVNVICPGWVDTALTRLNKFSMPFMMPAEKAAQKIIKGLEKDKAIIAFPWQVNVLLGFLHLLPLTARVKLANNRLSDNDF